MSFTEDGYQVFPDVLDDAALDSLVQAVASLRQRFCSGEEAVVSTAVGLDDYSTSKPQRNSGVELARLQGEPYILGGIVGLDFRFHQVIASPSLWQIAGGLLDCKLNDVVFHYAQVVRKPALIGPALSWHRDYANTYISTDGPHFVRLLIPLQGMDADNGGTGVVPGTHRMDDEEALRREGMTESGEGAIYPNLAPGHVLAIHSKIVHGGGTNRTHLDRDLLTIQFGLRSAKLLHSSEGEPHSLSSFLKIWASS